MYRIFEVSSRCGLMNVFINLDVFLNINGLKKVVKIILFHFCGFRNDEIRKFKVNQRITTITSYRL